MIFWMFLDIQKTNKHITADGDKASCKYICKTEFSITVMLPSSGYKSMKCILFFSLETHVIVTQCYKRCISVDRSGRRFFNTNNNRKTSRKKLYWHVSQVGNLFITWAASREKVLNSLSRCHTKRRMGAWYDTDFSKKKNGEATRSRVPVPGLLLEWQWLRNLRGTFLRVVAHMCRPMPRHCAAHFG